MKRIRIRPRADKDFDGIIAYFRSFAPEVVANIAADVARSLDLIKEHPEMYPVVPGKRYRRHVTQRYRFKIIYEVGRDRINILGIYRFQNRST